MPRLDRRLPSDERATAAHPGTEQYRLFSAVDAILADAARRWPTLVVIDDLQWASSQSLALLRHLSSRGAASRLLLVGTFRDTADEVTKPLASCLAELRRSPTTSRLRLKGLDQATVEQFVASAVGHGSIASCKQSQHRWSSTAAATPCSQRAVAPYREQRPGGVGGSRVSRPRCVGGRCPRQRAGGRRPPGRQAPSAGTVVLELAAIAGSRWTCIEAAIDVPNDVVGARDSTSS